MSKNGEEILPARNSGEYKCIARQILESSLVQHLYRRNESLQAPSQRSISKATLLVLLGALDVTSLNMDLSASPVK
jgi:hypothetical protein